METEKPEDGSQAAVKDSIPNDSVKETQKAKSEMKREHPM